MTELAEGKRQMFEQRLTVVMNNANLALLIGVGHQTGLFDTMAQRAPETAEEIARRAGLNQRYVREWLDSMVVAELVVYTAGDRSYQLPAEHAAALTRAAGPRNQAMLFQYIAMFGEVEQQVVQAFRHGGGVPFSAYPRYQKLRGERSAVLYDEILVDSVIPIVPGLTERLRAGINVLDIGTGQGHAVNVLAREFPHSSFAGVDISEDGIAAARAEAQRWGLTNAHFTVSNSTDLADRYDLITTFDVIHDLAEPDVTLSAIRAALRPDGVYVMADVSASSNVLDNIGHQRGVSLYGSSIFHCMTTSLGQGGEGLGTMWGRETALDRLAKAGFTEVSVSRVAGDPVNEYFVARVGQPG